MPPHFFKVVLSATAIGIPRKFIKLCGSDLSSNASLKVPSGATWLVELKSSDGGIWFQNGWKQFADYYSIGHGDFLVFRYMGNSKFHVLIFDKSATEIDYPINSTKNEEPYSNEEFLVPKMETVEEDDVSVEILDEAPWKEIVSCEILDDSTSYQTSMKEDVSCELLTHFPPSKASKKVSQAPCHKFFKKMKTSKTWEREVVSNQQRASNANKVKFSNLKKDLMDMASSKRNLKGVGPKKWWPKLKMEKLKVAEKAEDFKPKNPFFRIPIHPSNLRRLNVPSKFAETYFSKTCNNINLRLSNGRRWSIKYSFANSKFSSGWRDFVRDNGIVVGDVCAFELVEGKRNSMLVIIFRKGNQFSEIKLQDLPPTSLSHCSTQETKEEVDEDMHLTTRRQPKVCKRRLTSSVEEKLNGFLKAKASRLSNPYFVIKMGRSYVRDRFYLKVPHAFAKTYLRDTHEELSLQVLGGRTWSVKCWIGKRDAYLSSGWKGFVKVNHLNIGDVCVFELIKEKKTSSMKVIIFRVSADAK